MATGRGLRGGGHRCHQPREIGRDRLEHQAASIDARDIEQPGHQSREAIGLVLDRLDGSSRHALVWPSLSVVLPEQHLGEAQQAGQGRPELVRRDR